MKHDNTKPTKFERIYQDAEEISVWKYDLEKNPFGPIETTTTSKIVEPKTTKKKSKKQKKELTTSSNSR